MTTYLRSALQGRLVALGPALFRKQLLRLGTWNHPDAPGGRLEVTRDFVTKVIENFQAGVRDDVPVPMGHDLDALSSAGHVVGLEQAEDGSLWGIIGVAKDEVAKDVEAGTITGGSALLALNHVDQESGREHGPTLVHWALTNAPYIKGLAGYEKVALGEQDGGEVVIALAQKEGSEMTLEELLAQIKEVSDEDLQKALTEARPELFKGDESESDDEALAKAKAEGASEKEKELVAALSEKGITVKLGEASEEGGESTPEVDLSKVPAFTALSEEVSTLRKEKQEAAAAAVIDTAIREHKVVPSQRDGLMKVALSEGGMETLKALIPEQPVVDTGELGVSTTDEPGVKLSETETQSEVKRLLGAYGGGTKDES